jgi:predicted TIM-barrel enzyme
MKSVTLLALIHLAVVAAVPVTAQTQSLLDLLTNGIQSAQVVMQGGVPALLVRMINPCESLRCPKGA